MTAKRQPERFLFLHTTFNIFKRRALTKRKLPSLETPGRSLASRWLQTQIQRKGLELSWLYAPLRLQARKKARAFQEAMPVAALLIQTIGEAELFLFGCPRDQ